uniref:Putative secreted protein n=1 Tax=Rhipicephalus microplus TaxID=6941 RepID=A0A6G5A1B7_RHIMP
MCFVVVLPTLLPLVYCCISYAPSELRVVIHNCAVSDRISVHSNCGARQRHFQFVHAGCAHAFRTVLLLSMIKRNPVLLAAVLERSITFTRQAVGTRFVVVYMIASTATALLSTAVVGNSTEISIGCVHTSKAPKACCF